MKSDSSLTFNQARDLALIDIIVYQHLIGKLIYLPYEIRSDIAFMVGQLSYYNSDPQTGHIYITKQTLQYLKKTRTLGII